MLRELWHCPPAPAGRAASAVGSRPGWGWQEAEARLTAQQVVLQTAGFWWQGGSSWGMGCSEAKAHMAPEVFLPGQQRSAWAAWNWHTCLSPLRAPFWMTWNQQDLVFGDGTVSSWAHDPEEGERTETQGCQQALSHYEDLGWVRLGSPMSLSLS